MKEEKKIFGTPDEDEFILDIGLNRAIELIERSNAENILFTEINSGLPIILKNGRFGEHTEYDGFNKATKLKPALCPMFIPERTRSGGSGHK